VRIALSLDVTDKQRRALAQLVAGKPIKRLAGRDEFRDFITGFLDELAHVDAVEPEVSVVRAAGPISARTFTDAEDRLAAELRGAGKCESYIRGYILAGRNR
jgi:hypothetical protein